MLKLQNFTFSVVYKAGSGNPADNFSRHSVLEQGPNDIHASEIAEAHVRFVVNHNVPCAMTLAEIQAATQSEPCLLRLINDVRTEQWHTLLEHTDDLQLKSEVYIHLGWSH